MQSKDIKSINYRLWLVLMLTSLVPLVYSTTRIHFLGNIPSSWSFSIAAQVAWLNVGYEVLGEALLIPLSFVLGQVIRESKFLNHRVKYSLGIIFICYLIVTTLVLIFTPQLVSSMQSQPAIFTQTVQYIRFESVAILISSIYAFLILVLTLKNEKKMMLILLIIQSILTVGCDSLFVSQFPISLKLGVNGIAFSNITVNAVLAIFTMFYLRKTVIKERLTQQPSTSHSWLIEWVKVGWKSGLESLVRNTAFIIMILQLVNEVKQSGTYWITNQFIWGWLLLPVLALGQLIRQDAATNNGLTPKRVNSYLWVTIAIIAVWLMSSPVWEWFISTVMGIDDPTIVVHLVWVLFGFYIVFALNNVIDSYFYGIGRTDLMLYQSLIVNTIFYGCAFICYKLGWFVPTLDKIAIMFGIGITIDAIITWLLYVLLRKQQSTEELAPINV